MKDIQLVPALIKYYNERGEITHVYLLNNGIRINILGMFISNKQKKEDVRAVVDIALWPKDK